MPNQGMTVEQFGQKIKAKYPQYANVPDADLGHKIIEKYPQYQRALSTSTPTSQTPAQVAQQEEKKPGLLQGLAQGIAKPFLKTATNVLNFGEGVTELGGAAIASLAGDKARSQKFQQMASEASTKKRDYGFLGKDIGAVGMVPTSGNTLKDIGTGIKDIVGTGAEIGSYLAPVGVGSEAVGAARVAKQGLMPVLKKAGEGAAFGALGGALGSAGSAAQEQGSTAGSIAKSGLIGGLAGGALGGAIPLVSGAIGKTATEASRVLSKDQRVASTITANERGLRQLEVDNASLRKLAAANKAKGVDPVKLLSQTDLLKGAVDETGTIRTTGEGGAVSQLQDFIKPHEDVVTQALAQEGRTIPLADVRQQMLDNINNSGIKGADKVSALNAVENEIKGLQLDANPQGEIPLSSVHDAKRYKYANINYLNPSSKNTDKIIARTLKDIVENHTSSVDIKELNRELGAHYSVLSLLEKLDGKKVQGGKLGRYFAKTIGGIAGSHFGPLGSIAGSEIAGKIQGSLLKGNFAGTTGKELSRSPLMEETLTKIAKAKKQSLLPRLALPAPAIQPAIHDTSGILSQAEAKAGLQARGWQGLDATAKEIKGGVLSKLSEDRAPLYRSVGVNPSDVAKAQSEMLSIPETHTINTPDRQQMRKTIADTLYGTGAKHKNKRIDIVIGPPAAGKSSRVANPLAEKHGSLVIDADMAKEHLPEFNNGIGANATHKESSDIAELSVLKRAVDGGDNVVLAIVGKNEKKVRKLIENMKKRGYDVNLHLNNVSPQEAAKRALTRWKETGRFVNLDYILDDVGNAPLETFNKIKKMPELSSFRHLSNEVPMGQPPKLIEASPKAGVLPRLR